jgi:hypothetical protein
MEKLCNLCNIVLSELNKQKRYNRCITCHINKERERKNLYRLENFMILANRDEVYREKKRRQEVSHQ